MTVSVSTPSLNVRFDALRSTAFGSITSSYVALGTPFSHMVRLLKFVNTTNADVLFSFDGITDNDVVPAGGFALYDFDTNSIITSSGTQVYIKSSGSPSSGTVYLTCVYARSQ